MSDATKTLYERLGGYDAIAAVSYQDSAPIRSLGGRIAERMA